MLFSPSIEHRTERQRSDEFSSFYMCENAKRNGKIEIFNLRSQITYFFIVVVVTAAAVLILWCCEAVSEKHATGNIFLLHFVYEIETE